MTVDVTSETTLEENVYIVDMVVRGDKAKRICIPCGVITGLGQISYADTTAVGYQITLTALSTEIDGKPIMHKEYLQK